jgi:Zn-dependent protease with chaperone function
VDFYSRQAAARGQSRWLVLAFATGLLAVALALDFVLFTFLAGRDAYAGFNAFDYARSHPGEALVSTLIVVGVLGIASLYKSLELRAGGGVVARSLGGVLVSGDTRDLKRKRLLNVVEEMAIASGVPMPEVYVLDQEPGINAFAAGHTPANAAITVTQGALDRLNRDELQGVIGHEFSHVLNGDMRLNVQLMGWVFGLFVIGLIGRAIVDWSPRNRRNSGTVALGFAVLVLGYVGMFAGRILQAAVSRQRERLADASGVQFTRNPQGLKGALVKIAALPEGSELVAADAEQAAHMFFAEGLSRVFATHPPLMVRIRELDPQFDQAELERVAAEMARAPLGQEEEALPAGGQRAAAGRVTTSAFAGGLPGSAHGQGGSDTLAGGVRHADVGQAGAAPGWKRGQGGSDALAGGVRHADVGQAGAAPEWERGPGGAGALAGDTQHGGIRQSGAAPGVGAGQLALNLGVGGDSGGVGRVASQVADQVGRPDDTHIQHAQAVRLALPPAVRELTESPGGAQALAIGLLISADAAVRERQLGILAKSANAASLNVVQHIIPLTQALDPMLRLPVLQRAFPALRRLTVAQRKLLAQITSGLIHADARVDVFEYCLAKLLETLLSDETVSTAPHGTLTLEDVASELALLFAVFAQIGAPDERAAREAYEVGMAVVLPRRRPDFAPVPDWQGSLSTALPRLIQMHPFAKKAVIEGLVRTVANDEMLMDEEAELLRTVCALLHCPLPVMLPVIAGDAGEGV